MNDDRGSRLRQLGFSNRSISALLEEGIESEHDLVNLTEREFLRIHRVGKKAVAEAKEALASMGMSFHPPHHLSDWPLPDLIDAFVRSGTPIEDRYLERCKTMLRAGLVPDSTDQPTSRWIGTRINYDLARKILDKLP